MSFPDDLRLAADWVEAYLERLPELPVAARVAPGEIRSRLPESAPEQAEPFAAVLADLDAQLLDGIAHWNHHGLFQGGLLAEQCGALLRSFFADRRG